MTTLAELAKSQTLAETIELEMGDPQVLQAYAADIAALRARALLADGVCACPVTQEHFALALDLLSQAASHIRIAALHQVTALTMVRG